MIYRCKTIYETVISGTLTHHIEIELRFLLKEVAEHAYWCQKEHRNGRTVEIDNISDAYTYLDRALRKINSGETNLLFHCLSSAMTCLSNHHEFYLDTKIPLHLKGAVSNRCLS